MKLPRKKILIIPASNSRKSINKKLLLSLLGYLEEAEVQVMDLNDYEMPIFSVDREEENGIHALAHDFKQEIIGSDGIIISFAEHNSAYSAAFKNIYDWVSRITKDVWEGKPMLLMSTAPGARGGKSVLEMAYNRFSRANKNLMLTFSLPLFNDNFEEGKGITSPEYKKEMEQKLKIFLDKVLNLI